MSDCGCHVVHASETTRRFCEDNSPHWQSIPAYLAGQENDLPPCELCGRLVDDDGEPVHRDDADWCSDCNGAYGMQHHALYVDRDRWWARGGHCLCDECAPPRRGES
jgi:hypothetical protein